MSLLLFSCRKEMYIDGNGADQDGIYHYTFVLENAGQTRSSLQPDAGFINWSKGDRVGVYASTSTNMSSEVNVSGNPATVRVRSSVALAAGDKVYSYFPYSEENKGAASTEVRMSIPVKQISHNGSFDADAMPTASLPFTLSSAVSANAGTAIGSLQYLNLGSLLQFKIFSSAKYRNEKVLMVRFTASSPVAGTFNYDLTQIDPATLACPAISGLTQKTVDSSLPEGANPGTSKADALKVMMVLAPGTYSGALRIYTNKAAYTWSVPSDSYKRSSRKVINADLDSPNATRGGYVNFYFTSPDESSFDFGEEKKFYFLGPSEVKSLTFTSESPSGWTLVSYDGDENSVIIKAPEKTSEYTPCGNIGLIGNGEKTSTNTLSVRLNGICSKDELLEFRSRYGGLDTNPQTTGLDKYLYKGEIYLHTDITLEQADMLSSAYFIRYLRLPVNGGGHKIRMENWTGGAGCMGLFQYLSANVTDLKLTGSITHTRNGSSENIIATGALASRANDGVTISKVYSAVKLYAKNLGSETMRVGGLIGYVSPGATVTISSGGVTASGLISYTYDGAGTSNSAVGGILGACGASSGTTTLSGVGLTGTVEVFGPLHCAGGLVAQAGSDSPGGSLVLNNCKFSGNFSYTRMRALNSERIGGFVGDAARNLEITGGSNPGTMTLFLNNTSFAGAGRGFGGVVGRTTKPTGSYNMHTSISNFSNTCTLTVNGCNSGDDKSSFGKSIGNNVSGSNPTLSSLDDSGATLKVNTYAKPTGSFTLTQLAITKSSSGSDQIGNSYIIDTSNGNVIVMDGGFSVEWTGYTNASHALGDVAKMRAELKKRGNKVTAWFISHPHADHIGVLYDILGKPEGISIDKVYHSRCPWVNDGIALAFYQRLDSQPAGKVVDVQSTGISYDFDGVRITVLGVQNPDLKGTKEADGVTIRCSRANESSMILRVEDANRSVVFLGDAGEECGDKVLARYPSLLNCDILQIAHHGQRGCRESFYKTVSFKKALWPTPTWVWAGNNGTETLTTRKWIITDKGISTNYVSGRDGDQVIP
ncbi:MAG: MBL fold metallo-hydrolase [Bacteroidales bacterium]|nr:MBL fold metallo-hydrolase [Bacteroidales bacterium]